MLFDPRPSGEAVALDGISWQSQRHAAARRRSADGFLTLPDVSRSVIARPSMKYQEDREVAKLAGEHFACGPLRSSDVGKFSGSGNALAQAMFAWIGRRCGSFKRLCFRPYLLDATAVQEQLMYQEDASDFEVTSPLYLGIETPEDFIYVIEDRAAPLRKAHPRLLQTALVLINRASFRTLPIRTPDELLSMFAQWNWEGDPQCEDEDAIDTLKERYGEDPQEFQHFLPSVVRDDLCPPGMEVGRYDVSRHCWRAFPALGIQALRRLRWTEASSIGNLCAELEHLSVLLRQAGKRELFGWAFRPNSIYAATSISAYDGLYTGDVLDTHYEYFNCGGEGSLFHGFIALATSSDAIRKQYADLALAFSILRHVDRVVSLITRKA